MDAIWCQLGALTCRVTVQCWADRVLVPAEPPLSTPAQAGHPDSQGGEAAQLESIHISIGSPLFRTRTGSVFNGLLDPDMSSKYSSGTRGTSN